MHRRFCANASNPTRAALTARILATLHSEESSRGVCLPSIARLLIDPEPGPSRLSAGLPDALTVPNVVDEAFPELVPWLDELAVDVIPATSGFQAGVRDLKTWEDELRYSLWWYPEDDLSRLPALAETMSWRLQGHHLPAWKSGIRELRYPPEASEQPLSLIPSEDRALLNNWYLAKLESVHQRSLSRET